MKILSSALDGIAERIGISGRSIALALVCAIAGFAMLVATAVPVISQSLEAPAPAVPAAAIPSSAPQTLGAPPSPLSLEPSEAAMQPLAIATPVVLPGSWAPLGPAPIQNGQDENVVPTNNVAGAVEAVAAKPGDANTLYVGAVNGGIWKTTNGTNASPTWTPLTDTQASQSIGALKFDPTDPTHNTLVAGNGNFSALNNIGGARVGLLRTTDGGANWTPINGGGTLTGQNISGVAARGSTIVTAANTADANYCTNLGIFRSINSGASFTQISGAAGSDLPGGLSHDLAEDPSDNSILYTDMLFADLCTGGTNGIYKSTDGGATWAIVSNSTMNALLTDKNTVNVKMAVGNSSNVYVAIENSGTDAVSGLPTNGDLAGLFRSSDGGTTWAQLDLPTTVDGCATFGLNPGGQGGIHLSIVADLSNVNLVYIGGDRQPQQNEGCGAETWPNSLGANSFSGRSFRVDASQATGHQVANLTNMTVAAFPGGGTASNSSPHADSRQMVFDANGNILQVGDGGIYRRTSPRDATGDWFANDGNLQVTELHGLAYDRNSKVLFGAAQDTGTPAELTQGGLPWTDLLQGDGDDAAVDFTSMVGKSIRYLAYYDLGGFTAEVFDASNTLVSQTLPALTVNGGGAPLVAQFALPYKVNAISPTRLLFGAGNALYESTDGGNTITELSPAIVVNDGFGHAAMVYGGHSGTDDADLIYAGKKAQIFIRTVAPPTALTQLSAYPGTLNVNGIAVDPTDFTDVIAVDQSHVFRSINSGASWTDITGNLATFGVTPFDSVEFLSNGSSSAILVGTYKGVFKAQVSSPDSWSQLGTGFPDVFTYRLIFDSVDNVLVAGTLGRGAWKFMPAATATATATAMATSAATATSTSTPTSTPTPTVTPTATATAVPAALKFAPKTVGFPATIVLGSNGATSSPKNLALSNLKNKKQDAPITISSIKASTGEFSASQNCVGQLAAGAECKVAITFTPADAGLRPATLIIASNASNPSLSVDLKGIGELGKIVIKPKELNFGKIATGVSSPTKSFNLVNRNPVPMSISGISSTDPEFAPSTACVGTLAAGGSCTVSVIFTPSASGRKSATISISDDAAKSPQTVHVVGIGK
ncbi:choice-of-anchor D domain-containing protein [Candidatus Binatus sp.]|uniref:choice-of-anchor D domain-containing protein n=1 Tax=Candidatus Binatus sp. TaxID=2811406 RepID=UPI002F93541E